MLAVPGLTYNKSKMGARRALSLLAMPKLFDMLDFRTKPKRKPGRFPQEQPRWIWLLFLLGVGLIVANQVCKPATWRLMATMLWGWGPGADGAQGPQIDNRLDTAASQSKEGVILAEGDQPAEKPKPPPTQPVVGLSPEQLDSIQDDSPRRKAEAEAWLQLLWTLHETDEKTLQKQSIGRATYADLFRQSAAFRGQIVTVRGCVRRGHEIAAPANTWGLERYYKLWLFPSDNPNSPMMVYCLSVPKDFPLGMRICEEAEVTGFYFKRSAYEAVDTLRTAPTLAAKTLHWLPAALAEEEPEAPSVGWTVALLSGVIAAGVLLAVLMYRRVPQTRRPAKSGEATFDAIDAPRAATSDNLHGRANRP